MEKGNALALLPVLKHAALSLSQVACFVGLGPSPSSLTAATCVASGHLVRDSPWRNARTGRGKRSLLGFAAWDAGPVDAGEGACASERVLRESRGERLERDSGERLERELARMYHLL